MVGLLYPVPLGESSVADKVKVLQVRWEPWDLERAYINVVDQNTVRFCQGVLHEWGVEFTLKVNMDIHQRSVSMFFKWLAVDLC